MQKKLSAAAIFLLFTMALSAQDVTKTPEPKDPKKLEKESVALLRETLVDVGNLRSLENRISFGSEMASLMWIHDEKEAHAMYLGVTTDLKQLLASYDEQMNSIAAPSDDGDDDQPAGTISQKQLQRKFQAAMTLRRQISLSLAEHEPETAVSFYHDSVAGLSNPAFQASIKTEDQSFEFQLMTLVAKSNVAKAAEFARRSLDKGVTELQIELLRQIYAKDADKGADLGSAMAAALKSASAKDTEPAIYASLLTYGDEMAEKAKKGGKKAVLTNSELHDLADALGQKLLSGEGDSDPGYADVIGKYAPSKGAQLKAKANRTPTLVTEVGPNPTVTNTMLDPVMVNPTAADDGERILKEVTDREEAEAKLGRDVQSLGGKELSKEERDRIVKEARAKIAKTKGKDAKIMAISMLAAQIARGGDKDLAAQIMKDAERLVNLQPKNYQDFLYCAMLASGYADVDPDRSFSLLTDTIFRLNDTISGLVKTAEFIDVDGEMISDGEFQVGQFGGSMIRDLGADLAIAQPTIQKLSAADFAKTKALTNDFDRPEVRVLAKMLVLRSVMEKPSGDNRIDISSVNLDGGDGSVPASQRR